MTALETKVSIAQETKDSLDSLPFDSLPIEIINKIINYTGVVTFYKGKYYNRIQKDDPRYTMLKHIIKLPHIVEESSGYLNNTSYSVIKTSITLRKDIGESYNTPRFRLMYSSYKNNAGEFYKERLEIYRYGRSESYSEYYLLSKEHKWVKTRSIMHYEYTSF